MGTKGLIVHKELEAVHFKNDSPDIVTKCRTVVTPTFLAVAK